MESRFAFFAKKKSGVGLVLFLLGLPLLLGDGSLANAEVHSQVLGSGEARQPVVELVNNPQQNLVNEETGTVTDRVDRGRRVGVWVGRGSATAELGHFRGNISRRDHLDINPPDA